MSDEETKEDTTTTIANEDKEEEGENVDNYYTNFFRKISKLIMDEVDNADKVTPELDNRIAEQLRPGHFSTRKNDFEKHHFCPLSKKLLVNPCKVTIIKTVAGKTLFTTSVLANTWEEKIITNVIKDVNLNIMKYYKNKRKGPEIFCIYFYSIVAIESQLGAIVRLYTNFFVGNRGFIEIV